eukprot:Sspe_Gene.20237::Locus_7428_Transcript_1_6_Confidence_0.250_Length_1398::g.20237::m.20237
MNWLKDNDDKDKRILVDELPDGWRRSTEGQEPTPQQVQAVKDRIEWKPEGEAGRLRDPDDDAWRKRPEDEDETIGRGTSSCRRWRTRTSTCRRTRTRWRCRRRRSWRIRRGRSGRGRRRRRRSSRWRRRRRSRTLRSRGSGSTRTRTRRSGGSGRDMIEAYQRDPEEPRRPVLHGGGRRVEAPCDDDEKAKREGWYKDNFWKAPKYSQQWRRDGRRGDGWEEGPRRSRSATTGLHFWPQGEGVQSEIRRSCI